MNRREFVLAVLSASQTSLTPVQTQKLFFLIDRKIPHLVGGPFYHFQPYHYGPFDRQLYDDLDVLKAEGLIAVQQGSVRQYMVSRLGHERGNELLVSLPSAVQEYVPKLISWITAMNFPELVSAIYYEFPDMKVNSVFRGSK